MRYQRSLMVVWVAVLAYVYSIAQRQRALEQSIKRESKSSSERNAKDNAASRQADPDRSQSH